MSYDDEDHREYGPSRPEYWAAKQWLADYARLKHEIEYLMEIFNARHNATPIGVLGYPSKLIINEALDDLYYEDIQKQKRLLNDYDDGTGSVADEARFQWSTSRI